MIYRRFSGFSFNNPKAEAQRSCTHAISMSINSTRHAGNLFGLLSQGYC